MNKSEFTIVVNGSQFIEGGMERGETVAEWNGVGIVRANNIAIAAGRPIARGNNRIRIFRNTDSRAGGVISRVFNGDDVVDAVVAAAEENEEDFLALDADGAFGDS